MRFFKFFFKNKIINKNIDDKCKYDEMIGILKQWCINKLPKENIVLDKIEKEIENIKVKSIQIDDKDEKDRKKGFKVNNIWLYRDQVGYDNYVTFFYIKIYDFIFYAEDYERVERLYFLVEDKYEKNKKLNKKLNKDDKFKELKSFIENI